MATENARCHWPATAATALAIALVTACCQATWGGASTSPCRGGRRASGCSCYGRGDSGTASYGAVKRVKPASPRAPAEAPLDQLQEYAVFGLVTTWAVDKDDVDDLVEQGRTLAAPRAVNTGLDFRTLRRMTGEEKAI
jgi:hypothetical protein